jgi:AraC family transcriptional regulator
MPGGPKNGVEARRVVGDTWFVGKACTLSGVRLLSGLARSETEGPPADAASSHRPVVERVVAAMRERADGPLTLRDMADVAHLSPYHFARVFKDVTGIPPGEFLGALRLERAKRLLLTTDLSVSEVCFEVGYESLGTFTARFKRLVGVSPGRMRRLPERLASALEGTSDPIAPARGGGVSFSVVGSGLEGAIIFVGLFPGAVPQGRPVAGTVLEEPGAYSLSPVPDGLFQLMAAAVPAAGDVLKFLLPDAALRVGRAREPVLVRAGRAEGRPEVELRPPRITDPPVLVALLPALLLERSEKHHTAR